MDLESKEEVSTGSDSPRKVDDKHSLILPTEEIEITLENIMEKKYKTPSHKEPGESGDGTESEATTKIPRSVDTEYDSSQAVFVNPDEGTPAAEALAANAALVVSKVTKGLHKLRVKRLTMKRLNIVKQLKKTQKGTQFSKNFKGKVIDGVHELYTLTAGMMLGIRCSVGRTTLDSREQLVLEDFSHVEKMSFPATGSNKPGYITPPHSLVHTFKFKSYSLQVFRRIRNFFGIDNAEYMMSVCGNYNFLEFISNSKSGQFFFYSHDGKYMIKTQTKEENKFMKRVLPHYYKFVTENPHTMLVRILGMHRVKMYHLRRKVHFVIMTSVFDTPEKIHTVYDLKGSLIGRQATEKERTHGGVLKDMDLVIDKAKLHLGSKKAAFMVQVEKDAKFLAELNIMDYSLLVGIHNRNRRQTMNLENPEEHEIAGPVGQHSNTPFRRNMSTAPPSAGNRPVSLNTSPYASLSRKISVTSPSYANRPMSQPTGFARYSDSRSKDKAEGEHEFGCDVDADHFSAVRTRINSLNAKGSHEDDPHSENTSPNQLKKSKSRGLRSQSDCSSADGSQAEQRKSKEISRRGSRMLRIPSSSSVKKRTPPKDSGEASAFRDDSEFTKGGALTPLGDDMEEYDDDDYSVDDEDIDLDFARSELEMDVEDEDHYDDGDSDIEAEIAFKPSSKVPLIHGFDTLKKDDAAAPASAPHTRRECEDEGEGLKGIEGSQLAPMLRMSIGGFLRAVPKMMRPSMGGKGVESPSGTAKSPATTRAAAACVPDMLEDPSKESVVTFGPGASQKHPWTLRKDTGINSREADGKRGDEIYYIGVIDILQQYNLRKRAETIIKSINNDSKQISSVDAHSYAKRFVKFIDGNII